MKPENAAVYAYGNGMTPADNQGLDYEPFKRSYLGIIRNYLKIGVPYTVPFNPHMQEFRDTIVAPTLMDVAAGKMSFVDANKLIRNKRTNCSTSKSRPQALSLPAAIPLE